MASEPTADALALAQQAAGPERWAALAPHADALLALDARARQAWPQLHMPTPIFLEHLVTCGLPWIDRDDVQGWLSRMHPEDLYLARCCVEQLPGAAEAFCALHRGELERVAARFARDDASREDMTQHLLARQLVGAPGRPAKLTEYSGQGFLLNWLRVSASRALIDLERARSGVERHRTSLDEHPGLLEAHLSGADLELELIKQHYRQVFKQAFLQAIAALEPRQRLLLRHHVIEGLTIDQIGALYGVHRATAARWLEAARHALAQQTRALASRALSLDRAELDSIMALIMSRLDVSMERALGATRADP